ncbi:MAG: endolytic transglycosylase MltG [Cellulosilyticaceae bacterium]
MKKRKSKRLLWYSTFSICLTLIGLSLSVIVFSKGFSSSYDAILENSQRKQVPSISHVTLTITPSTTLKDVATRLHDEGLIGSKGLFLGQGLLMRTPLNEGTYSLNSSMTNTVILDLLTTSTEDTVASIKLTIPEGFTLQQIAAKVEDLGLATKDDFLDATRNHTYPYDFLKNVPSTVENPLEGYLFPDTYFIQPGTSSEEIIIKMLNRFQQVTDTYMSHLYGSSYTLHDVLTIASIIEEEAKLPDERPLISGVIYNRLTNNYKLQMCSTVQYTLTSRKATLSLDDLATPSPYNTYLHAGLPVGPICSPGESSIKAAFMPEEHDYFYFVVADPTEGTHAFSQTAEEHAVNKNKYNQSKDQNFMD